MKHEVPRFMDAVHAALFRDKWDTTRVNKEVLGVQAQYRTKLRAAQRFILDDDSTRLVCRLSHESERLSGWSFLARLPYETLWIEYDQHVKLREFEDMNRLRNPFNPDEVAPRVGLLMYKDAPEGDSTPRWLCHSFIQDSRGWVAPQLLTYVFDPEGDMRFPVRGSRLWRSPTLSLRPGFPRMPVDVTVDGKVIHAHCDPELTLCGLFGPAETLRHKGAEVTRDGAREFRVSDDEEFVSGPEWLTPRMAVICDPWWEAHLAHRLKTEPLKTNRLYMIEAKENAGHLRWIVALLAAINGLPRDIQHHKARTGKHSVGMYQLPFFGSSTISLNIPRENRLIHARKKLDHEAGLARRRRHWVMGHWRIVERSKRPAGVFCRHMPTMVEEGLAICERCQLLVRWIESHERGDATLGVVEHDYELHAKR